jgi:hypothetical protein
MSRSAWMIATEDDDVDEIIPPTRLCSASCFLIERVLELYIG